MNKVDVSLTDSQRYYLQILEEELIPAMGCTEPIAIAYAAAVAASYLRQPAERIRVACSSNVMKNARSAHVPHTGGRKGIEAAALAGALAGRADAELEVLASLTEDDLCKIDTAFENNLCTVTRLDSEHLLHIAVTAWSAQDEVEVEVVDFHTNIVRIARNGEALYQREGVSDKDGCQNETEPMTVNSILTFCETVPLEAIRALMHRQIDCNIAIAQEGLSGKYGVAVSSCFDTCHLDQRIKAYTAAASEARMSGCELPVIINSGSGNQGISASVPVILYARDRELPEEKLLRALALSNLLAIRQKKVIGSLSAFCGAVSATCASGAAIAYLASDGDWPTVHRALKNTLAMTPGMVCDGAKPSCGAKISAGLDAALLGCRLALAGRCYEAGDGIVMKKTEDMIDAVGAMARKGMLETDRMLFSLMIQDA